MRIFLFICSCFLCPKKENKIVPKPRENMTIVVNNPSSEDISKTFENEKRLGKKKRSFKDLKTLNDEWETLGVL